ncbi:hypothetical protein FKW77_010447 [Venturia effusa]|uniref:Uncharacterized protein n=1 Tax=Venturia effusa TaxID=50376 RepID=A0A517L2F6_9PEZI|nr:hypothetical protein FKW77_010447 [Venturia effusa]
MHVDARGKYGPREYMDCLETEMGAQFLNKKERKDTFADYEFERTVTYASQPKSMTCTLWQLTANSFIRKKDQAINVNMEDSISMMVPLSQPLKGYTIRMSTLSSEQLFQSHPVLKYQHAAKSRKGGIMSLPTPKAQVCITDEMLDGGVMLYEMKGLKPIPKGRPPSRADDTLRFMSNNSAPVTLISTSGLHPGFRQLPPTLWNERS